MFAALIFFLAAIFSLLGALPYHSYQFTPHSRAQYRAPIHLAIAAVGFLFLSIYCGLRYRTFAKFQMPKHSAVGSSNPIAIFSDAIKETNFKASTLCLWSGIIRYAAPCTVVYSSHDKDDPDLQAVVHFRPHRSFGLDYIPPVIAGSRPLQPIDFVGLNEPVSWILRVPPPKDPPQSSPEDLDPFVAVTSIEHAELGISVSVDVGNAVTTPMILGRANDRVTALLKTAAFRKVQCELMKGFKLIEVNGAPVLRAEYSNKCSTVFASFRKVFDLVTRFSLSQKGTANHACRGGVMFANWPDPPKRAREKDPKFLVVALCFGNCERAWDLGLDGPGRVEIARLMGIEDATTMVIVQLFSSTDVEHQKSLLRAQNGTRATTANQTAAHRLSQIRSDCSSIFRDLETKNSTCRAFLLMHTVIPLTQDGATTSPTPVPGGGLVPTPGAGKRRSRAGFSVRVMGAPSSSSSDATPTLVNWHCYTSNICTEPGAPDGLQVEATASLSDSAPHTSIAALLTAHTSDDDPKAHSQFDCTMKCLLGSPSSTCSEADLLSVLVLLLPWNTRLSLHVDHADVESALAHVGLSMESPANCMPRALARTGLTPQKPKREERFKFASSNADGSAEDLFGSVSGDEYEDAADAPQDSAPCGHAQCEGIICAATAARTEAPEPSEVESWELYYKHIKSLLSEGSVNLHIFANTVESGMWFSLNDLQLVKGSTGRMESHPTKFALIHVEYGMHQLPHRIFCHLCNELHGTKTNCLHTIFSALHLEKKGFPEPELDQQTYHGGLAAIDHSSLFLLPSNTKFAVTLAMYHRGTNKVSVVTATPRPAPGVVGSPLDCGLVWSIVCSLHNGKKQVRVQHDTMVSDAMDLSPNNQPDGTTFDLEQAIKNSGSFGCVCATHTAERILMVEHLLKGTTATDGDLGIEIPTDVFDAIKDASQKRATEHAKEKLDLLEWDTVNNRYAATFGQPGACLYAPAGKIPRFPPGHDLDTERERHPLTAADRRMPHIGTDGSSCCGAGSQESFEGKLDALASVAAAAAAASTAQCTCHTNQVCPTCTPTSRHFSSHELPRNLVPNGGSGSSQGRGNESDDDEDADEEVMECVGVSTCATPGCCPSRPRTAVPAPHRRGNASPNTDTPDAAEVPAHAAGVVNDAGVQDAAPLGVSGVCCISVGGYRINPQHLPLSLTPKISLGQLCKCAMPYQAHKLKDAWVYYPEMKQKVALFELRCGAGNPECTLQYTPSEDCLLWVTHNIFVSWKIGYEYLAMMQWCRGEVAKAVRQSVSVRSNGGIFFEHSSI